MIVATSAHSPKFILLLVGALYFAQGVPLGVAFGSFPALLRQAGVSLALLAWLPLVALPWAAKFLWSPVVDSYWIRSIGRRKTWLLSQQALMIVTILAVASLPISMAHAPLHLALLAVASFLGATQDIATDGLIAEHLGGRDLLLANMLAVGGMILGTFAGGAGLLLVIGELGFELGLGLIAVVLAVCAIPAACWQEKAVEGIVKSSASFRAAKRPELAWLLCMAAIFATAHSAEASLAKLVLVDRGWSFVELGRLDSASQLAMLVLGCGAASWGVMRFGARICLVAAQVAFLCVGLFWLSTSLGWISPGALTFVLATSLGASAMGLASVAAFSMMTAFARGGQQAGTDVTVLKSANVFGEIGAASLATAVAAQFGYASAFCLCAVMAFIALATILLRRRAVAPPSASSPTIIHGTQ